MKIYCVVFGYSANAFKWYLEEGTLADSLMSFWRRIGYLQRGSLSLRWNSTHLTQSNGDRLTRWHTNLPTIGTDDCLRLIKCTHMETLK